MRVVIDTNLLWVSISRKSNSHWLFESLLKGKFQLAVTTDIIAEYEEIIASRLNPFVAAATKETLANLRNVIPIAVYYRWNLITADADDNKFTDCAIAGSCDYIVTHDRHFNAVRNLEFPPVKILNLQEFKRLLKKS